MEQGFYVQVVMILQRESYDKEEKEKNKNITSKDNQQDQDVGSILIMSGQRKISGDVNNISTEKFIRLNFGVRIQKHIKYMEYQLVIKK